MKTFLKNKSIIFLVALHIVAVVIGLWQITQQNGTPLFYQWKKPEPQIAIVQIQGMITSAAQGPLSSNLNADQIAKHLKWISEQKDIQAVVLRMNTPGGSVAAVQEIYDELLRVKNSGKKIVVSMGEVAASGGYYLAAPADYIIANPGSITGSIGVIFQVSNVQGLFKKIGVQMKSIKSAEHKDIGSPFKEMSDKERKIIQSIIDGTYQQFVQVIVEGRKMNKAKVLQLADGRIYSGAQAKELGLIDDLGNLEKAIAKAVELSGIEGKPKLIEMEDKFHKLFSMLGATTKFSFWSFPDATTGAKLAYAWEYGI